MGHYNLNYHAQAFEQADSYLFKAIKILSEPPRFLTDCIVCAKDAIAEMPDYLDQKIESFYSKLSGCKIPEFPVGGGFFEPASKYDDLKDKDTLCKKSKFESLKRTIGSIR